MEPLSLQGVRIGFGLTGSFCTFERVFTQIDALVQAGAKVTPITSYNTFELDTRFFSAAEVKKRLTEITGEAPLHTLSQVEPIGPKRLLDLMIIAPCTGNSLAKLYNGIVDTPVLMAAKSHLRNLSPLLIAISTNDGLSNAAKNIGGLLNMKHIYFVPFGQDDPEKKPNSLVANMELLPEAAKSALAEVQLQPVLQ